jgi:hypothetical protein
VCVCVCVFITLYVQHSSLQLCIRSKAKWYSAERNFKYLYLVPHCVVHVSSNSKSFNTFCDLESFALIRLWSTDPLSSWKFTKALRGQEYFILTSTSFYMYRDITIVLPCWIKLKIPLFWSVRTLRKWLSTWKANLSARNQLTPRRRNWQSLCWSDSLLWKEWFITVFTRARHWTMSYATLIQLFL